jgi:hypothetical protein
LVGPLILLSSFLSNTLNLDIIFSFSTHVLQAYVTTSLTNVWYIRSSDYKSSSFHKS